MKKELIENTIRNTELFLKRNFADGEEVNIINAENIVDGGLVIDASWIKKGFFFKRKIKKKLVLGVDGRILSMEDG